MDLSRRSFLGLVGKGVVVASLGGVLAACGDGKDSIYTKSKPIIEKLNDMELNKHINLLEYFAFNSNANQIDYNFGLPEQTREIIRNFTKKNKLSSEEEKILYELIDIYVDRISLKYNPNG